MATSTAIIVSETVKTDVVYSAECFDQSYKTLDTSTQLLVEYSSMALKADFIDPETLHQITRYVDGTIDVINGCLAIGSFAFPPAAPILMGIAACGAFIQTMLKWIPDNRPNKVIERFRKLEKAIHQLEAKMAVHFADMQSFITEHNFNVNFTTQASTLSRYIRDCLQYQNEADVENLTKEYNKNTPLNLVYSMATILENRSTNPLIMAMSKEKGKTKATFKKWKTIITGILGEFLFIETFASGLLNKSEFDRDRIIDQWNEITEYLEKWEEEIKQDQGYWDELKEFLEPYIVNEAPSNHMTKVLKLYDKLETYLTNDSFFVCAFNEAKWGKDYFYLCDNENDHIIGVWNKGGCNCFIYRSHTGNTASREQFDSLYQKMSNRKLYSNLSIENAVKFEFSRRIQLRGFIGLFLDKVNFQSSHPNGHGMNSHGPGATSIMIMEGMKDKCWALVAFP